jgi:hypothetical protein
MKKNEEVAMAEGRLGLAFDIWRAKRQGPDAMIERQRARLAEAVAHVHGGGDTLEKAGAELPQHQAVVVWAVAGSSVRTQDLDRQPSHAQSCSSPGVADGNVLRRQRPGDRGREDDLVAHPIDL